MADAAAVGAEEVDVDGTEGTAVVVLVVPDELTARGEGFGTTAADACGAVPWALRDAFFSASSTLIRSWAFLRAFSFN